MSNRQQKHRKAKERPQPGLLHVFLSTDQQSRIYRAKCAGGCGRETLRGNECRSCRQKRMRAARKKLNKAGV